MLTFKDLLKNIEDAKKLAVKAKVLHHFYKGIYENAKSNSDVNISFDNKKDTDLSFEVIDELLKNDYDFKRYVVEVDDRFREDFEVSITYDLDKPLLLPSMEILKKIVEVNNEPQYASDDIPF